MNLVRRFLSSKRTTIGVIIMDALIAIYFSLFSTIEVEWRACLAGLATVLLGMHLMTLKAELVVEKRRKYLHDFERENLK